MRKLLCITGIVLLTGCAADPIEQFNDQQAAANELAVEQAKEKLANLPDWYLKPPKSDSMGIVAVGAATSKDMHHAVKKSKLQAEFALAKNYKQELSGTERIYEREGVTGELIQTSLFLIDKLVDSVPVVGYEMLDQQVQVAPDGKYQVYTLLKLPFDEFNKVLQQIKSESQDAKELAAFDDLERRLEAKRLRKSSDLDREHERKIELMDARNSVIGGGQKKISEGPQVKVDQSNTLESITETVAKAVGS
ncbi:hypothetical protein [Shewanella sp. UCD-KL12]|uniref:hypothetical protein n=1 Tax=Shewanella sp. UCD-KL12 TaxID=1917163 RepID=UPI000970C42D|nr:hypothetical protein [Shewanella sp. UCD-KL12]